MEIIWWIIAAPFLLLFGALVLWLILANVFAILGLAWTPVVLWRHRQEVGWDDAADIFKGGAMLGGLIGAALAVGVVIRAL
jgi:hypothetical protein